MPAGLSTQDAAALRQLRASLIDDAPAPLGPNEDDDAFKHHLLLAMAVHRASRLDRRNKETDTSAWTRYLTDHFPAGRNGAAEARLLFDDWRCALLKDRAPGPGIVVTHGQPHVHWTRNAVGQLCLNLEDLRADYVGSVGHFIGYLRAAPLRRKEVLIRWRNTEVVVAPFTPVGSAVASAVTTVTTVGSSSAMASGAVRLP